MLLTLGACNCNSPAGTAAWEYALLCLGYHPDANEFRRWRSVSVRQEV
jgi:hypothetical protein